MEYTVGQLAALAGVSRRTLRYYDQIGLLCPQRSASGYRRYGPAEVDRLQQILFFRALGVGLGQIADILASASYDAEAALAAHLEALLEKRAQLDALITNAQKTLRALRGEDEMRDKDKFEGFKKQLVEDNEARYGAEVRQRYGDAEVDASNRKLMGLSQAEYEAMQALSEKLNDTLRSALQQGDAASPLAQQAAALHREWLCFHWPEYSPEAHRNLAQMYVDDARFTAYYEAIAPGAAAFLRDAVALYTKGLEENGAV